jgi:glycosyltransferase involved in cell wall biosynthesis
MGQEPPSFSIIIPTYNRSERLAICLQSLTQLEYPQGCFEVIVVDDGGEKSLEAVVASFLNQLDITLLTQTNAGPATARNRGAGQAKGQFLAFTDDDCLPDANWLQALATRFAITPDCLIGGRTLNILAENPYSTASQILIDYLYGYYNANPNQARFLASNNFALPADRFHSMGGFDITYARAAGEDREFCDRWLSQQYSMIYAPEAVVYHAHQLGLYTFWRQHFNYGRGAFCFRQMQSLKDSPSLSAETSADKELAKEEPIKVEPLSFYGKLLIYPFLTSSSQPAFVLSVLLLISQIANTVGFFWEKNQQVVSIAKSG